MYILHIPGLGRNQGNAMTTTLETLNLRLWWRVPGEIFPFGWDAPEDALKERQERLLRRVDTLRSCGENVALVGVSGGGSAALNGYMARSNERICVVNVCGRSKEGQNVRPTLEEAARRHLIFRPSVLECEEKFS
jgi:hypothetical protein